MNDYYLLCLAHLYTFTLGTTTTIKETTIAPVSEKLTELPTTRGSQRLISLLLYNKLSVNFKCLCIRSNINVFNNLSGSSCYSVYKVDEACEENGGGRDINSDGNLNACIQSNLKKGNRFVVWYKEQCWGSNVCNSLYGLSGTISYDISSCAGICTLSCCGTIWILLFKYHIKLEI